MSSTFEQGPQTPVVRRAPRGESAFVTSVASLGQMGSLAMGTIRAAARPPFSWWRDTMEQSATGIRRSMVPMIISHACYLIGFGTILFGIVLHNLGVVERQAGAMYTFWARELGTWITSMVFTGVVGSAITADLAARKIREELDALAVLGVDRMRTLVVPRVLTTTLIAPVLAFISLAAVLLINYIAGPAILGYSHGVFRDNVMRSILPMDLLFPVLIKNLIIGFVVGVIACHKGLTCGSGAEGVGKAVNQTVILSFLAIWTFNSFFNLAYLSLYPTAAVVRG